MEVGDGSAGRMWEEVGKEVGGGGAEGGGEAAGELIGKVVEDSGGRS